MQSDFLCYVLIIDARQYDNKKDKTMLDLINLALTCDLNDFVIAECQF